MDGLEALPPFQFSPVEAMAFRFPYLHTAPSMGLSACIPALSPSSQVRAEEEERYLDISSCRRLVTEEENLSQESHLAGQVAEEGKKRFSTNKYSRQVLDISRT